MFVLVSPYTIPIDHFFKICEQAAELSANAAKITAAPLPPSSPGQLARRSLQELAQNAPLLSPEMIQWAQSAAKAWQQSATASSSSSPALNPHLLAATAAQFPLLANMTRMPQLTPESMKAAQDFMRTTARSFIETHQLSNAIDAAVSSLNFTDYRIPASHAAARNLRRLLHDDDGGDDNGNSGSTNAQRIFAALDQLRSGVGAAIGGPAKDVTYYETDVYLSKSSSDTTSAATTQRRRLSSSGSSTGGGDVSLLAADLHRRVQQALTDLYKLNKNGGGAVISSDQVKTQLSARALGLKQQYDVLKFRLQNAARATQKRRLLSVDDDKDTEDTDGEFYYEDEEREEHEQGDEEEQLNTSPPRSSAATMIIIVQPTDTASSLSFMDDVIGFLFDTLHTTVRGGDVREGDEEDPMTWWWGKQEDEAVEENGIEPGDGGSSISTSARRRRRHMLSADGAEQQEHSSLLINNDAYGGTYEQYDEDALDNQWLWGMPETNALPQGEEEEDDEDDWLTSETAIFEEAVLRYADEANENDLIDLVVRLAAPSSQNEDGNSSGGISLALLQILADPQAATVAELLKEMSSQAPGSEISVTRRQEYKIPRFAIFGPAVTSGFHQSSAVKAQIPRASQSLSGGASSNRVIQSKVDVVVGPLRGPTFHPRQGGDVESAFPSRGVDARWWGVVLGVGALGLLFVASGLAAIRSSSSSDFSDDSVHGMMMVRGGVGVGAGGGGGGEKVTVVGNANSKEKSSSSTCTMKVAKKTSSLPA